MVALELGGQAGPADERPDIASPRPTEIASMMIATMPKARLASQKTCWVGSAVMRRTRAPVRRCVSKFAGEHELAVVEDQRAAVAGEERRRPRSGPRSSAVLASVSASSAVGASAVAWITPVHAGVAAARGRSGGARSRPAVRQTRVRRPLVATAPQAG